MQPRTAHAHPRSAWRRLAASVIAPLILVGAVSPAGAATGSDKEGLRTVSRTTWMQETPEGEFGTALTLEFDEPQSKDEIAKLASGIYSDADTAVNSRAATAAADPGKGPQGARLACSRPYRFTDGTGAYTIQHRCGSATAPWGYNIGPALCGVIISLVSEDGMSWARNGRAMPRQAPHHQACTYQWHGTYNPARDNDHISYVDLFRFQIRGGRGTLQIYGNFKLLPHPAGTRAEQHAGRAVRWRDGELGYGTRVSFGRRLGSYRRRRGARRLLGLVQRHKHGGVSGVDTR